ncbi:MAG: Gfo/Idh/MocA family oxidoreductase [Deltaproteobacteria bacterium]|nr:Gfo/Idh/MocA family oxidoreductase [Deltaproteobacteria bacterium]
MVRVAVAGAGAWGANHVRAFARAKGAELVMVCDPSDDALRRAQALAPRARAVKQVEEMLASKDVDAVVLATPAITHAALACHALESGKHVLVEKPLALSTKDAERVVATASRAERVLMVGHLMLYHPVVTRLRTLIDGGELGRIYYLYALRVNLGRLRSDENAMWSLAPHDVSMILHLLGEEPDTVSARGGCYLQQGIEDVAFMNMRFPSGILAQVQLSWLDPCKERRLTIVGSQKMVEFDDVHPVEKLRIYDKGFSRPPQFTEYAEYLSIRNGDVHIPHVSMAEPLELECRHFLDCIEKGTKPLTDGFSALRVVRVLELAQRSLEADGRPIPLGDLGTLS